MQCSEYKVTCLSRCDGCLDGLPVSHFADEYNVRVLTERCAEARSKTHCVFSYLTLVDSREVRCIDILDRVFKCDDVASLVVIDVVEHRRQACRFTGTRLTGNKDDSLVVLRQIQSRRRQSQCFQFRDLVGEQSQRHRRQSLLAEYMDTAAVAGKCSSGVQLACVFVNLISVFCSCKRSGICEAVLIG